VSRLRIVAFSVALAAAGCAADTEAGSADDALINGIVVPKGYFASVVRFDASSRLHTAFVCRTER
jgi:hypothetical protein